MVKRINRAEFRENRGRENIIIDTCQMSETEFETMVLCECEELDCIRNSTESEAHEAFNEMINKYANPFQRAVYNAGLTAGNKYTLVFLNEFGSISAQKITFEAMELTSYAQHVDAVRMIFTPYKRRNKYQKYFYDQSLLIFKGWQDLKEDDVFVVTHEDTYSQTKTTKYGCFDSRYIEDAEKNFINPVLVYKNYQTGANGKVYA